MDQHYQLLPLPCDVALPHSPSSTSRVSADQTTYQTEDERTRASFSIGVSSLVVDLDSAAWRTGWSNFSFFHHYRAAVTLPGYSARRTLSTARPDRISGVNSGTGIRKVSRNRQQRVRRRSHSDSRPNQLKLLPYSVSHVMRISLKRQWWPSPRFEWFFDFLIFHGHQQKHAQNWGTDSAFYLGYLVSRWLSKL